MSEQTPQPEVLGGTEEQKGRPIPEVSEVSAAVTPSSQKVDTDALAAKLADMILPKFEEQARKRAQSVFDKTSYQFETMAEYLKAAGGDPKKAARDMALDQVAQREMARQNSEPEVRGRTEGEDAEARTANFLNELKDKSGIAFTDDELKAVWNGKRYTRIEDAFKDVERAAWKRAKQGNVGAGAAVGSPGGQTPEGETDEELTAKFEEVSRNPVSRATELKRVQAELKKRGLLK